MAGHLLNTGLFGINFLCYPKLTINGPLSFFCPYEVDIIFVMLYTHFFLFQFAARPGFQKPAGSAPSAKSFLEPVPTTDKGVLPADYVMEDPDSHFIYVCKKMDESDLTPDIL